MSITGDSEKKFVIRHVFKDYTDQVVDNGDGAEMSGPVEKHFGVEWKLRISNENDDTVAFHLDCLHPDQSSDWKIETKFKVHMYRMRIGKNTHTFTNILRSDHSCFDIAGWVYSSNKNMPVEIQVTIKKMTGIEREKLKNFDDVEAKECSDIVLKIGDRKFYVLKKYLASHSSFFKSLFSQNFAESQKSEIELKDIDAQDFQDFLELIHGVTLVNDETVSGILKLADYFDAPIALQRCEEFLMKNSKNSLAEKFEMSIQYKMENLKSKCSKEMKNSDDDVTFDNVPDYFDYSDFE